ncbi:MAG: RloB family protein [Eubacteriales bacterium]|nr:RloB family protein [Eubacteriales bacterium]
MARKDRTGNRKTRDHREKKRLPEMGYYLVVTDTEATERCFFNGLHDSLPESVKQKLVIKVVETKTQNLIQKCRELTAYEVQYRIPWIVFDRDQVPNFDEIIKEASGSDIHVGWSNPCFEIWMFTYFGIMPVINESWTCCSKFGELYEKRTGQKYSKADADMYQRLTENGDESSAINLAQRKYDQCIRNGYSSPSQMCPCTTVHELVKEIQTKVNNGKE